MLAIDKCFDQAITYYNYNMHLEAVREFERCIALDPNERMAYWYRAMALLALGDYPAGFKAHECRWDYFDWAWGGILDESVVKLKTLPVWKGEPLDGRRVILHHEQGFGDDIMMFRYIPALKALGANITALMPPALHRLVSQQFSIPCLGAIDDTSSYDYRCGVFDVMVPLKQTAVTIPGEPYIRPNLWKMFRSDDSGVNIGIAWSGRSRNELSLGQFLQLLNAPAGSRIYSIQIGNVGDSGVFPFAGKDFADVADLIANMDHIVTVDTGAAHLAGAMGHPSQHLVVPWNTDWRWHRVHRWYPTINLYRQPLPGNDWSEPFEKISHVIRPQDGAPCGRAPQ